MVVKNFSFLKSPGTIEMPNNLVCLNFLNTQVELKKIHLDTTPPTSVKRTFMTAEENMDVRII